MTFLDAYQKSIQRLGLLLIPVIFGGLATVVHAQNIGYDAVLGQQSVPNGESTVLQLRFTNCQPESLPTMPEVDGLSFSYNGDRRNSSYSFSNGRQLATVTTVHQFTVTPSKEGTFVIPPIEATIKGKAYRTKALKLVVSKGRDYSQYAFIRVRVPKQTVYVGEVFQLAVDLYEINAKLEEKPVIPSDGFVIDEAGQPTQSQTRVGNQVYNRVTFRYLARAVKDGELSIGPITWKVPLFFRQQSGRRQRGAFDSFFRDLVDLNSTVRRDVTLNAAPVALEVRPLPEEAQPEGFNGAVGSFTMDVSASPVDLTAGDPITLTMKIEGRGALEALKMPSFEDWREFKQYPETATTSYRDKIGLSGTKTFEKVVIPNNSEITELPEIRYSFFDPQKEAYQTLTQAPIPLTVAPNLTAATRPTMIANADGQMLPANISTNIVHIKPHFGVLASASRPWINERWFLWLQFIPLLGWGSAVLFRIRKNATDRNPQARRAKKVRALIAAGVLELRQLAQQSQSDAFFALLFRLLQEQIGERLNLPATAITEAVIDSQLKHCLPEPEALESLERLFHTCNQSRYAPVDSTEELTQLADEAEEVLKQLQALRDPGMS